MGFANQKLAFPPRHSLAMTAAAFLAICWPFAFYICGRTQSFPILH